MLFHASNIEEYIVIKMFRRKKIDCVEEKSSRIFCFCIIVDGKIVSGFLLKATFKQAPDVYTSVAKVFLFVITTA